MVETGRKGRAGDRVTLKIRRERPARTRRAPPRSAAPIIDARCRSRTPGQNIVEIELETAPGELTTANNRVVVAAEGVRENLRVLLVSGEPHAGERVWRNLLKSDAAVDLVHFTILRPPEKQDGTPINQLSLIAFPTRELFSEKIERLRPDHLRPLPAPRHPAAALSTRTSPATWSRAAPCWSPPATTTPAPMSLSRTPLGVVLPATPTGRAARAALQGASSPATASKHPVTRGLPGTDAGAGKDPTWGRWFRQVDVGADARPHRS